MLARYYEVNMIASLDLKDSRCDISYVKLKLSFIFYSFIRIKNDRRAKSIILRCGNLVAHIFIFLAYLFKSRSFSSLGFVKTETFIEIDVSTMVSLTKLIT